MITKRLKLCLTTEHVVMLVVLVLLLLAIDVDLDVAILAPESYNV